MKNVMQYIQERANLILKRLDLMRQLIANTFNRGLRFVGVFIAIIIVASSPLVLSRERVISLEEKRREARENNNSKEVIEKLNTEIKNHNIQYQHDISGLCAYTQGAT